MTLAFNRMENGKIHLEDLTAAKSASHLSLISFSLKETLGQVSSFCTPDAI